MTPVVTLGLVNMSSRPTKSVDLGAGFLNLASCSSACEDCRKMFWTRNAFVTPVVTLVSGEQVLQLDLRMI